MNSSIADRKLWDDLGNYCRIEMFHIGKDTFELYLHDFNDAVPRRRVGTLGICNSIADCWMSSQKAKGFVEQLPSYNPHGTRET